MCVCVDASTHTYAHYTYMYMCTSIHVCVCMHMCHVFTSRISDLVRKPGNINRNIPPPKICPVVVFVCLNVSLKPFPLQAPTMMHHVKTHFEIIPGNVAGWISVISHKCIAKTRIIIWNLVYVKLHIHKYF